MFHLELRQFPHTVNRFNLDEAGLWAVLEPWVRERPVELGERRWSPHQATIKVIEGPEIPLQHLTMGRGWRAAERGGENVTEHVLAQARAAVAAAAAPGPAVSAPAEPVPAEPAPTGGAADSAAAGHPGAAPLTPAGAGAADLASGALAAGVELAQLLGSDSARLLAAWGEVVSTTRGLSPSESLALAERRLADGEAAASSGGAAGG